MEVEQDHNYITALGTVLHNCVDALRYMVVSRTMAAQQAAKPEPEDDYDVMDYDDYMRGGTISKSYLGV